MTADKKLILILGGARSGKSKFAEGLAARLHKTVTYLATSRVEDSEMLERIAAHKARRPGDWKTVEEDIEVPRTLRGIKGEGSIIIDCLTVWLSNLLYKTEGTKDINAEEYILKQVDELIIAAKSVTSHVLVVSNEVGMGIVPAFPAGRKYRDIAGKANQKLAEAADEVYLVVAGLPLELKSLSRRGQI